MKDGSHITTGAKGEQIACDFLVEKGYKIVERNVRRKWGEIDVVCIVPRGTMDRVAPHIVPRGTTKGQSNVPRGTIFNKFVELIVPRGTNRMDDDNRIIFVEIKTMYLSTLQPEDNMTLSKRSKLIRTCGIYLTEMGRALDSDWQIDVVAVVLNRDGSLNEVRHLEQAVY